MVVLRAARQRVKIAASALQCPARDASGGRGGGWGGTGSGEMLFEQTARIVARMVRGRVAISQVSY